jgi:hypothetical protein
MFPNSDLEPLHLVIRLKVAEIANCDEYFIAPITQKN